MFARLKSLPLTILLTILIWMYAEAEFSSTQEGVPVRIQFQSSDPAHFTIRAIDENGANLPINIDLTLTLQGAKDQIDRIVQQSRAAAGNIVSTLIVTRDPQTISDSTTGTVVHLASLLSQLPLFHDKGVVVVAASPNFVRLKKSNLETFVPAAPIRIEVKGPPEIVSPVSFTVTPKTITVSASGSVEAIAKLRAAMTRGGSSDDVICAYIDISADDKPDGKPITKRLRYYLPEGITLESKIDTVELRLTPARP